MSGMQRMTVGDEQPRAWWDIPAAHRTQQEEQAFVSMVSGALFVPDAAPEIRMIAEIMASMSIPSAPREIAVVATQLAEVRARRTRTPLVTLLGRKVAAISAAAAVAFGALAASAYANMLPDSIQDVAHSVIDAPKHHEGGTTKQT